MDSSTKSFKIFSDGGSRGNPGPAAIGWVAFDGQGHLSDFDSKYIGEATNNIAEYSAILDCLTTMQKNIAKSGLKVAKISCHLDSELAVKQLIGVYKIKNPVLQKLHTEVHKLLLKYFGKDTDTVVEFIHVPREQNKFADKLVNIALDAKLK